MPDNPLFNSPFADLLNPGGAPDATALPPTNFSAGVTDTNQLPTNIPSMGQDDAQKGMVSLMQELAGRLDPNNASNQDMTNRMTALQYTPEQRAQDQYNKMFGISKDAEGKSHRNWLKTLTGGLAEVGRGSVQKGAYVPPMERLRDEATKQYQAESQPLVHELQYGMQDRRALEGNLSQTLKNFSTSIKSAGQQTVADRNSNLRAQMVAEAQKLTGPKRDEYLARIQKETSEAGLYKLRQELIPQQVEAEKARTGLLKQQTENARLTGGMGGDSGAAMAAGNMPGGTGNEYLNRLLGIKAAEAPKQIVHSPEGDMNYNPRSTQLTPLMPPGAVPNNGTNIGATKPKFVTGNVNGMPVPVPYDWSSPKETYPQALALQTLDTRQFKDVPAGHTAENDGLFAYPSMVSKKEIDIGGQRMSPVQNSMNLLQNGDEFKKILASIPDNQLGTIMGNLQKAIAGKSDWADPTGKVQALINAGHTVAWSHLASQGSRSAIGAEEIASHLASLGLNREGILNGLQAWLNQAGNVIRQPENGYEKPNVASLMEKMYPGQGYHKMLELYDPEYHKKQAAAAYSRKYGKK